MNEQKIQLRYYQKDAINAITESYKEFDKVLIVAATGCHDPNQELLQYNGKTKKAAHLNVGGILMGPDGTPRTILKRHDGTSEMYKISPVKGKPFIVNGEHKLTLVRTNQKKNPKYPSHRLCGEIIDVTVEEYLTWNKHKKHLYKLIRTGVDFNYHNHNLKFSPYVLGLMLGDGSFGKILSYTTMDDVLKSEVENELKKHNIYLSDSKISCGKAICWNFKCKDRKHHVSTFRKNILDSLNLNFAIKEDKHIPFVYKTATKSERLEILAGLIDSDGHLNNNTYDIVSISRKLIEDIVFIARSLGFAAYISKCQKSSQNGAAGTYWRVIISGETSLIPCRLSYKKASPRKQKKSVLRTGFSIENVGKGNYVGFTVDGDNRYLLDDFTITHNCGKTIIFNSLADKYIKTGKRVLILAHRGELISQAISKFKLIDDNIKIGVEKAENRAHDTEHNLVVASVQSLSRENRLSLYDKNAFDLIIIDEAHHVLAETYLRILNYFNAKVLGVTATPSRGDKQDLSSFFEAVAYEYNVKDGIDDKFLSRAKICCVPIKFNLDKTKISAGDFSAEDLDGLIMPEFKNVVKSIKKYAPDRKILIFLPRIYSSMALANMLNEAGFKAKHIDGKSKDREEILKDYADNKIQILCNSNLLLEGYDEPSIDCVINLRATKIQSLYSQILGRGTRICENKQDLLILEYDWRSSRHEVANAFNLMESDDVLSNLAMNVVSSSPGSIYDVLDVVETAKTDIGGLIFGKMHKHVKQQLARKDKLLDYKAFAVLRGD